MENHFEPVKNSSTSQKVADAIRNVIISGKIRAGEQLPSERSLAVRFKVTRNTVREALRRLEQLRLVSVRHGKGVTVEDFLSSAGLEFVADLLDYDSLSQIGLMVDIAEARAVIGSAMVSHAIDKFRIEKLDWLNESVLAFEEEAGKPNPDLRALQELDFEIHNRLMQGGGNRAIILLHNSMRHIYRRIVHLFEALVFDPEPVLACYKDLIKALLAGRRNNAKKAMKRYFDIGEAALATMSGMEQMK